MRSGRSYHKSEPTQTSSRDGSHISTKDGKGSHPSSGMTFFIMFFVAQLPLSCITLSVMCVSAVFFFALYLRFLHVFLSNAHRLAISVASSRNKNSTFDKREKHERRKHNSTDPSARILQATRPGTRKRCEHQADQNLPM